MPPALILFLRALAVALLTCAGYVGGPAAGVDPTLMAFAGALFGIAGNVVHMTRPAPTDPSSTSGPPTGPPTATA